MHHDIKQLWFTIKNEIKNRICDTQKNATYIQNKTQLY